MTQYTNIVSVPAAAWTNVGTGPAKVQLAGINPVQIIASDTQPSGSQGFGLAINGVSPTSLDINQTTTIWAYAPTASAVVVHATPGLPIYDAYSSPVTNTWTNATTLNTAVTMTTNGMDSVALTIIPSGTITAGAVTFEVYDGANWVAIKCARESSYNTDSTYNCVGATSIQGWTVPVAGFPQFRARLSTALAGTTPQLVIATIVSSAPDVSIVTTGLDPNQSLHPGARLTTNVQSVAVGASSVASTAVLATTNRVTLIASTACWVNIGSAPTAVAASGTSGSGASIYVPSGIPIPDIVVTPGVSKIAAIQASAAGYLTIIESN